MDENKGGIPEQEAPDLSGTGAAEEPETEQEGAQGNPSAAADEPVAEPKNDKQSAREDVGQKPPDRTPASKGTEGSGQNAAQEPAEPDPLAQAKELLSTATQALLTSRAEGEAARLNIPEARVKHVLRMAELDGIDPMAADAAEKVKQALENVLADVPELRGGGTGTAGAFRKKSDAPADAFERGFLKG